MLQFDNTDYYKILNLTKYKKELKKYFAHLSLSHIVHKMILSLCER